MMPNALVVRLVDLCARYRWTVIGAGLVLLLGTAGYVAARLTVETIRLSTEWPPSHGRQIPF